MSSSEDLEIDSGVVVMERPKDIEKVEKDEEKQRSIATIVGAVDDDRLAFPELATGEVNRLFSNLEYSSNLANEKAAATHAEGSVVGAAALIAGTTIGAGVLALPSATAPAGFIASSAGLSVAWAFMAMSGLLIAELSINRIGETGRPGLGLLDLYDNALGKVWSRFASAAYFFLHYAIMVAYVARGGELLGGALDSIGVLPPIVHGGPQVLFAGSIALALYFAKSSDVEKVNNALVFGVGGAFFSIMALGFKGASFPALLDSANQHPGAVVDAFPILFLSLVYQNIVPTIVTQLEGDRKKIFNAIVGGTAAPLLMFLSWNAIILGNVFAMEGVKLDGLDPIALLQTSSNSGPLLGLLVNGFSALAITTSLIGFVYGLLDGLTDIFGLPTDGPSFEKWKPALYAAVMLPPIMLSLGSTDIFYKALDYGGAFGVSTLFLLLPPIMIWNKRYRNPEEPVTTLPLVPSGKVAPAGLFVVACGLIVEQGLDKLGLVQFLSASP